jgi:tRNA pseudouridine55 synthase
MSRRRTSLHNGLLPVYKEAGPTSHDVVDMARKALRERRIGHTGTLDPAAEGLLLLCVGVATRLQHYLLEWNKTYHGRIRLGHATTTYDGEGEATDPQGPPPTLSPEALRQIAGELSGTIEQLPPPYSAKKVAGKKLYELARSGREVTLEPKTVTVQGLHLEADGEDALRLEVTASSGFYVRSLAHDIGLRLGCGGYLEELRRVRIGPYAAADALPQDALVSAADPAEVVSGSCWRSLDDIDLPFIDVELNPSATERFTHGQEVVVFRAAGEPVSASSLVTVRGPRRMLLGIGTVQHVLARGRTLNIRPSMVLDRSGAPR